MSSGPGRPKSSITIAGIAEASIIAADTLQAVTEKAKEGISLAELDSFVQSSLLAKGASSPTLHYSGLTGGLLRPSTSKTGAAVCGSFDRAVASIRHWLPSLPPMPLCGFPGHFCASVNHVVCHGVPNQRVLQQGDIVKLDVAAVKDGLFGDTCATLIVGGAKAASSEAQRLIEVTREALFLGLFATRVNATLGDIGHAVQAHAEAEGFQVVVGYDGHGVGFAFHEPPSVTHKGLPGTGHKIAEGLVFTIEPILTSGSSATTVAADGWSVLTQDGTVSAQWEHTVAVTRAGPTPLTVRIGEALPARLADASLRAELLAKAGYHLDFRQQLEDGAGRLLRRWASFRKAKTRHP